MIRQPEREQINCGRHGQKWVLAKCETGPPFRGVERASRQADAWSAPPLHGREKPGG